MTDFSLHPSRCGWAWRGVAEWDHGDGLSHPWRVRRALARTAHNEHFTHRVRTPAGVRAEVVTDADALTVAGVLGPGEGDGRGGAVDVVVDGVLTRRVQLDAPSPTTDVDQVVDLPAGPKTLEVWLPHTGTFGLRRLALHGGTTSVEPPRRPRWLAYGSSITHCVDAPGPSETWPAIVARTLGLDLYGLGLGGQCHLDHAVGQTIAEQPLDVLSLCLGINIYGRASFDARSLGSALHGFVARALEAHPRVPVLLMSPTVAPRLECLPNHVGLTLEEVRETVRRVAVCIDDARVTYLDGREVLGPDDVATYLRDDQLHPTAAGYRLMAERLTPHLSAALGLRTAHPDGSHP